MSEGDRERLTGAIERTLSPLPEVRAALLFGSRATGRARPDSDVDVAVLLERRTASHDAYAEHRRLLSALSQELAADRADLVILNDAPPALAFQVLKHGAEALVRDPRDLLRFRVKIYGQHADYEPVERMFREAVKKRALGGQGG